MSKKQKMKQRKHEFKNYPKRFDKNRGFHTPEQLTIPAGEPGVFFGTADDPKSYVGMPQGEDGNIIIVGGSGSGKSTGIIMPTLRSWKGAICATDIKGEISACYERSKRNCPEMRPYIIFDPMNPDSLSYDPFWWVTQDEPTSLYRNMTDIACTIIPHHCPEHERFWGKSEQAGLAAGLSCYYWMGLSFSECLSELLSGGLSKLQQTAVENNDQLTLNILGDLLSMKDETISSIDRGIRNALLPLVADPHIAHAFRGEREGARCFTWADLEHSNIFLKIPTDKVEQWGGAFNLMYAQLIRYLERRPEKHSEAGKQNVQTLLMLDEFPRFGKLIPILGAIPTLRSKNVNICLAVQSSAQLDALYGIENRRDIFDNCQYQAILRADDADTQEYLCKRIGTTKVMTESFSRTLDNSGAKIGYAKNRTEVQEPRIFPHELSTLNDVVLLSPYGVSRVDKLPPCRAMPELTDASASQAYCLTDKTIKNERMLTMEDRSKNAHGKVEQYQMEQRKAQRVERERSKKMNDRRNIIVGELVVAAFPVLAEITLGTAKENENRFQAVRQLFSALAADPAFAERMKRAVSDGQIAPAEAPLAEKSGECVTGQTIMDEMEA